MSASTPSNTSSSSSQTTTKCGMVKNFHRSLIKVLVYLTSPQPPHNYLAPLDVFFFFFSPASSLFGQLISAGKAGICPKLEQNCRVFFFFVFYTFFLITTSIRKLLLHFCQHFVYLYFVSLKVLALLSKVFLFRWNVRKITLAFCRICQYISSVLTISPFAVFIVRSL